MGFSVVFCVRTSGVPPINSYSHELYYQAIGQPIEAAVEELRSIRTGVAICCVIIMVGCEPVLPHFAGTLSPNLDLYPSPVLDL